jgi:tetratricopeptide (TPR) repeat protein
MPHEIMTRFESGLFTILMVMVLGWFFCVNRLSHQLRDRYPEKYNDMGLAELWPRSLQWFSRYDNSRPVGALLRFVLGREDTELHDAEISRLSRFMRWFFCVYVGLFLSLVFVFVHRTSGYVVGSESATVQQQRRNDAFRLHRAERWEEAMARYDQLLREWEPDAELHYYRGAVHWKLGHPDQALEDFRRVIDLDPTHFDAHRHADWLLSQQQRWDEVLDMWNAYIAHTPSSAEAYFERGGTNFHKGDVVAAQADAAQACRLGKAEGCVWAERLKTRAR